MDFVLIAGDLYEGDWQDFNTGLFFNTQVLNLREAHIPAILGSPEHTEYSVR